MNTGIYKIKSKSQNKIYIGSSIDIERRWKCHTSNLKNQVHGNYKLQNIFNTCELIDLEFSILELCQPEERIEREQFWIDKLLPEINIVTVVTETETKKTRIYKDIILVHDSGKIVTEIKNLSEFCRENKVIYTDIYNVLNHSIGYRRSAGGWYLLEDFEEPRNVIDFSDVGDKIIENIVTGFKD
jgi:group I intron endonuclease